MNDRYIPILKKRAIGEIITDTFKFLRRNVKGIAQVFVKTTLVPFVLLLGGMSYYTYKAVRFNIFDFVGGPSNLGDGVTEFLISFFILLVTVVLYTASLYGMIAIYIKQYEAHRGQVDIDEVVAEYTSKFGTIVSLGITQFLVVSVLVGLFGLVVFALSDALGIGGFFLAMLLLFPLIYVIIRFLLIYQCLIHEDSSITGSFYRSIFYVQGHWWSTFLTAVIVGLLVWIIGAAFQMPATIYTLIKAFTAVNEGSLDDPSSLMDGIYITLQVLANGITYLLYAVTAIAINLVYFNLKEHKTQSGSLESIDRIGE